MTADDMKLVWYISAKPFAMLKIVSAKIIISKSQKGNWEYQSISTGYSFLMEKLI